MLDALGADADGAVVQAIGVSVTFDRIALLGSRVADVWLVSWAVRSDETLRAVDARVTLAIRGGSSANGVLAVVVGGTSDIDALEVSAKSGLVGPAAVIVGSALVGNAIISDASAVAVFTTRNTLGLAGLMSDTLWFVASVGGLVAKLIVSAHCVVGALDVDAFLFDTFVSIKTSVLEETFAVGVASALDFFALGFSAKFLGAAVGLVGALN